MTTAYQVICIDPKRPKERLPISIGAAWSYDEEYTFDKSFAEDKALQMATAYPECEYVIEIICI